MIRIIVWTQSTNRLVVHIDTPLELIFKVLEAIIWSNDRQPEIWTDNKSRTIHLEVYD